MQAATVRRRDFLGLALASTAVAAATRDAHAQGANAAGFPSKPITMVVPFPAGGATDGAARLIADKLRVQLGQPVLVDNKPGASGILGTDFVARAPADGHTVVFSLSTSLLINQFLYKKLPYNPQKDLALVSHVVNAPIALLVHPSLPASNAVELAKYISANKGKISYGSWGVGSAGHLSLAEMSQKFGADMTHVAYKGEAPMLQDLVGGQIQMAFASTLQAKTFAEAGKLKIVGVTGEKRSGALPNSPTLLEQGWKDDIFRITGWAAVAAPAATPKPVIDKLAEEIRKACELPEVRTRMLALLGSEPTAYGPEQFAALYARELPVWQRVVKDTGASLD
ncbi:tripartite tricarboxylate transporter substrate binding protein [Variovorax sp. OV329]|uniref:Bug family tripartite tricarboxylate transporter substrate binding protein n=1 Tax=Variovorax sp. OV329 TaxID=1882825 RepID=UPI0008EE3391|nr:tripartite tricarboxylate transporter substrate binding protein [Variovorax sp. OV329]SFN39440.1 Tripartite-type tricarboxylate transporter, receptor component TctC [Variovorax sp. OV329]